MSVISRSDTPEGSGFVYVLAAIGCVILGLVGGDYAFLIATLVPAVLCLVQAYYQWRVIWAVIFTLYLLGSLLYLGLLILDVIALSTGGNPRALVDLDDSIVFVVLVALLVGMTWLLYQSKPRRGRTLSSNNALEQTRGQ